MRLKLFDLKWLLPLWALGFFSDASGQVAITLPSGAGAPGSIVNLSILLNTTSSTTMPAALQWTMSYPTAHVSSITVAAGAEAMSAGKTVSCNEQVRGTVTCIVFGLNQTTIANGVVAVAAATIAPGTTSTLASITMSGAVASAANATVLSSTTTGNTITINQPVVTASITIATSPAGRQIIVDGSAVNAPQTFQWIVGSQHSIGTSSPQGSDGTRHLFSNWSDGGAQFHTITTPLSAATYIANFTTQYLLTTGVSPAASGTVQVSPTSSAGYQNSGAIVQFTASPSPGFQFISWSGISASTATAVTAINGPLSVTATFSAANNCTYTLSRTTYSASSEGDFGRVPITTGESCNWTASSSSQWLSISAGAAGTGNGVIGFTVAANPDTNVRSGTLTIGGQPFVITQAGSACGSNVFVTNAVLTPMLANAGTLAFTVSAPASCPWAASVPPGWITVTSGTTGTGPGNLQLSIAANQTANPRMATVQIGGSALPLIQLGTTTPQFYSDVSPSHLFIQNINLLVLNGVLSGCSTMQFCPDVNATRAEAAPLIVRALLGENFAYSPTPYFADVPVTHQFFKYIQKMRELEVTIGCTTTQYCPNDFVTRGHMAAFLIRAKLGASGIPVVGGSTVSQAVYPLTPYFQDVLNSHIFFPFIQKIKQLGITFGCTLTEYCPDGLTTRGQLAAFLTRGFLAP